MPRKEGLYSTIPKPLCAFFSISVFCSYCLLALQGRIGVNVYTNFDIFTNLKQSRVSPSLYYNSPTSDYVCMYVCMYVCLLSAQFLRDRSLPGRETRRAPLFGSRMTLARFSPSSVNPNPKELGFQPFSRNRAQLGRASVCVRETRLDRSGGSRARPGGFGFRPSRDASEIGRNPKP